MLGKTDDSVNALQRVPPDDYRRLVAEGAIAARAGKTEEAARALQSLSKGYGDTVNFQLAEIYAQMGDADKAIQALHRGVANRDSGVGAIRVDPFLDPVRSDPRFAPIVKQVFG